MKPSESEIDETIKIVESILEKPALAKPSNAGIKQGMEAALRLLKRRETEYNVGKMLSVQATAIAVCAIDYLRGDTKQEFFTKFPIPE